ncbi:cupin domain-containing protein [Myxosarcina sp. GI1(2024)]
MKAQPLILKPKDYSPALNVVGTKVTVLVSNLLTRSYEITLQSGDEGTGPPLHSHAWDESFYVLTGTIEFTCAGAGTLVHVPAGTVHSFRYGVNGGKMLELTGKGSLATRAFTAVSEAMPLERPEPSEIPDLVEVLTVLKQFKQTK